MTFLLRRVASALAGMSALVASAGAAQVALYPTGPAEDSAFLRFVNTTGTALTVTADGAQSGIELAAQPAATGFQAVPANRAVQGTLVTPSGKTPLSLSVAPGEFATVVAASGDAPALHVVREQPDDFNAMRASLALAVADPACKAASLGVAGREVSIFQDVASGSVARRAINPVRLAVQARCAGQPVGTALDLGELAPGGRYTVILAPSAQGTQALFADDQAD